MTYYFVCFVLSLILTVIYFLKWNSHYTVYFTLMYLFVPITNFGYWQLSVSTQLEQAILANKILYLGACFAPLTLLMNVFYLCKIRLARWIPILLFTYTIGIYISVLTIGYHGFFYQNVLLEYFDGRYILVKEYGPIHVLFYAMLFIYFALGVLGLLYSMKKKKDVSIKNTVLMLTINFFCIFAFTVGRVAGGVELTAVSYDISLALLLVIADRLVLYDVDETVVTALMSRGDMGVASFDLKYHFLGCNDMARKCLPQLEKLRVDGKLNPKEDSMGELGFWIKQLEQKKEVDQCYQYEDKYCRISGRYLCDGSKIRGYQFVFQDCTAEKRHEDHLICMSLTDEMTKLYNRRAFVEDVEKLNQDIIPGDIVMISMDLNGLKRANDSKGHAAGDELIRAAAECMREAFGDLGRIYRTGGDEFVCLLHCEQTTLEKAVCHFREKTAEWKGNLNDSLAVSLGAAGMYEYPGYTPEQLEREAEKRMYQDKSEYYKRTGIDRRRH